MSQILEHARYHEIAFEHLLENENCHGWAIIAAFYAAMKYIELSIFPVTIEGKIYTSSATYYEQYAVPKANRLNRKTNIHKAIKELVETYAPEINVHYRSLYDKSQTIRYNSKMFAVHKAAGHCDIAKNDLAKIKEHFERKINKASAALNPIPEQSISK